MADAAWPIVAASIEAIENDRDRRMILFAFALEGDNSFDEARRILAKIGNDKDRSYFESVSLTTLSNLKKDAIMLGLLQPMSVNRHLFSDTLIRKIESELYERRWAALEHFFKAAENSVFKKLIVLPSHLWEEKAVKYEEDLEKRDDDTASKLWSRTLAHFGLAVAPRLYELLRGVTSLGIAYGQTLGATFDGLEVVLANPAMARHMPDLLRVFPLAADVESLRTRHELNSTSQAHRVSDCLGAREGSLSLSHIPPDWPADKLANLHDLNLTRIFRGGSEALALNADAIITGIGKGPPWHDQWIHHWPLPRVNPADLVGDIGGALLPKDLSKEFPATPGRFGWVGLSRQVLRTVAKRGKPGVIAIAAGRNKWRPIEKALLDNTVSVAIIDDDAAEELLTRLEAKSLPSPSTDRST